MAERVILRFPGEREPVPGPIGRSFVLKASAEDARDAYSLVEFTAPPGGQWGARHVHDADEAWYILEGELTFHIGDETFSAPAGSFVLAPGGVPHSNANTGPVPAKFLILFSPPGLERYLADFAAVMLASPNEANTEALDALAARHGITFVERQEPT
jgi:mannose-6-phosphate isomerase-like protein (cupin superfamily)